MASGEHRSGRVVVLNGGSSAGKTTLGRGLQAALADPWLLLGIDLFIWALPPEMVDDAEGLSVHDGVIVRGGRFLSLYAGFRRAVGALASSGVDVLLDDVALDAAADQRRWDDALEGVDPLWVGVRCAPGIAAEREARRQSRLPGIAWQQAASVHVGVRYDVEVDTGVLDPAAALSVVIEAIGRRWPNALPASPNRLSSDHRSTLPATSAWSPGDPVSRAPWER